MSSVGRSGVGCAVLTGEKGLAFLVCCGAVVGNMAHLPVPLVEKTRILAAGAGRLAG